MRPYQLKDLFTRFGFFVGEQDGKLHCTSYTKHNKQLFYAVMDVLGWPDTNATMTEEAFLQVLRPFFAHVDQSYGAFEELHINGLDLYMVGVVMQLNRLGLRTALCCEGHQGRLPKLYFHTKVMQKKAAALLKVFRIRFGNDELLLQKEGLPRLAQRLAELSPEEIPSLLSPHYYEMPQSEYAEMLEELLSIDGVSGEEHEIREHVLNELKPLLNAVNVDNYGNVYGQLKVGNGPVVLVNAHMDTVYNFEPGREIVKDGDVWTSSAGILGADDRAGIGAVLAAIKTVKSNRDFRGTLKVIFTVEEESGLHGARNSNEQFTKDVDMAFVVDRRGNSDLVTSNWGGDFCTEHFANRLRMTGRGFSRQYDRPEWQTVVGGSSDTVIWAARGINSINISAGYMHEHTANESLNITDSYYSYLLLVELITASRSLLPNPARRISNSISKSGVRK
ncbi:M20/M25/M40 family metallo-hydrolase [Solibacillus sp. FSL H8-0538]|uniref:M20/M25/M40 family metallo-hydrolase n=1 Tax=Solibacillus sp. FSL H8-0538 TaxID=2921400 RepID=UPI0030F6F84A